MTTVTQSNPFSNSVYPIPNQKSIFLHANINDGADEAADSCVYAARYFTVHAAALTARIQHTSSDSRTINVFS